MAAGHVTVLQAGRINGRTKGGSLENHPPESNHEASVPGKGAHLREEPHNYYGSF